MEIVIVVFYQLTTYKFFVICLLNKQLITNCAVTYFKEIGKAKTKLARLVVLLLLQFGSSY